MARDDRSTFSDDIVADDQSLAEAIERLLLEDRRYVRLSAELRRLQEALKGHCDDAAWRAYLEVEAKANERMAWVTDLIARLAFEQGQQFAGQRQ